MKEGVFYKDGYKIEITKTKHDRCHYCHKPDQMVYGNGYGICDHCIELGFDGMPVRL